MDGERDYVELRAVLWSVTSASNPSAARIREMLLLCHPSSRAGAALLRGVMWTNVWNDYPLSKWECALGTLQKSAFL